MGHPLFIAPRSTEPLMGPDLAQAPELALGSRQSKRGCPFIPLFPAYENKTGNSHGITKVSFKGGDAGKPSLQVLAWPGSFSGSEFFNQDTLVTVQLHVSTPSQCWSSSFTTAKKNDGEQFKAATP